MNRPNCPVVWIVQELRPDSEKDISSVMGYGTLDHLLPWQHPMPSVDPANALRILRERIKLVRDGDYIFEAPGCDPIASFLVGVALYQFGDAERVRWLRWDRRTDKEGNRTRHGYYTPVDVNFVLP